jgi:hypothetical protein
MVRDPWWLYAYWEVRPEAERAARSQLRPEDVAGLQSVLRIYDVTDDALAGRTPSHRFDIRLSGLATDWHIQTDAPNRTFFAEIGLLTRTGRFLALARSNRVTTPPNGPSEAVETQRVPAEASEHLLGAAGGPGVGPTAWWQQAHQMLTPHSSSWALVAARPVGVRQLWVRVEADLVLYGVTQPQAKVTIQGQPVAVHKDGRFSLRVALPEGTRALTIDVTAPDGRQTRTLTRVVTLAGLQAPAPEGSTHATRTGRHQGQREERG